MNCPYCGSEKTREEKIYNINNFVFLQYYGCGFIKKSISSDNDPQEEEFRKCPNSQEEIQKIKLIKKEKEKLIEFIDNMKIEYNIKDNLKNLVEDII